MGIIIDITKRLEAKAKLHPRNKVDIFEHSVVYAHPVLNKGIERIIKSHNLLSFIPKVKGVLLEEPEDKIS